MALPSALISAIGTASTLPQVASALGITSAALTPDQAIALLQAVAELHTSAALQRIGDLIDAQGATDLRLVGALETASIAQTSIAESDAKIAVNTTPAAPTS